MPLGRKRSVLISLCVNSCVFWQRPWKEGLKTINILSTMSYCYHIVESHQDFGTILTGDQQCNLGKPGCFITETVLNLDLGRNRLGLNVQTIYLAPDLSCSFFISVILKTHFTFQKLILKTKYGAATKMCFHLVLYPTSQIHIPSVSHITNVLYNILRDCCIVIFTKKLSI